MTEISSVLPAAWARNQRSEIWNDVKTDVLLMADFYRSGLY